MMLTSRELLGGSIKFIINEDALGAVFERGEEIVNIADANIKYIPSALVEHLLPANKAKLKHEELAEKNAAIAKFLREHPVELVWGDKGCSLHFEYSQATYYSQIALSLAAVGGGFATGGIAAPLLFAFGAGTLIYSVSQKCQDLDWSSFALEGSVGAVTTVATMGLGQAAQGARTLIKSVESPLGRQALHFGVNGAAALGGRIVGAGTKAVATGKTAKEFKDFTGKSVVSTVVSAGLGGFAGAVAGKASVLASALDVSKIDAIKKGGTHGLAAGAVAGAVGSGSVDIAWGLASGGDLSAKDVARAAVQGAMTGASAGAVAGARIAARTYDNLSLAKTKADAKAKAEADARAEAEADAKAKAEARAKAEADAKAKAEARAKAEADAKAKAEARAKAEADAKAKAEARTKAEARAIAEDQARAAELRRLELDAQKAKQIAECSRAACAASRFKPDAVFEPRFKPVKPSPRLKPGSIFPRRHVIESRLIQVEKAALSIHDQAMLYVNGMNTVLGAAREQARRLAATIGRCVALKHNPADIGTAIEVIEKNPKLPFFSRVIRTAGSVASEWLHSLPFVNRQSRAFEADLIKEIQEFVRSRVDCGKRAHLTTFSLGAPRIIG